MLGKRSRKAVVLAVGLTTALALTACDDDDDDSTGSAPTASAEHGGDSSETGGSGDSDQGSAASGGSGGQGATDTKARICHTDSLQVSAMNSTVDDDEDGVVTVSFKNTADECVMKGFPGVDLQMAEGSMSADRDDEKVTESVVRKGETAAFNIYFTKNNTGGSGVQPTSIVVTPPNETKNVTVKWPAGSLPLDNPDTGEVATLEVGPVSLRQ